MDGLRSIDLLIVFFILIFGFIGALIRDDRIPPNYHRFPHQNKNGLTYLHISLQKGV